MNANAQPDAAELPPHEQLRALIDSEAHMEVECQAFLNHANGLLVMDALSVVESGVREQPGVVGRSDYFVVCRGREGRNPSNQIWLWEVKSPQHYVFEVETRNRLRPSDALFGAENQLLYYHYEMAHSELFRARYQVLHSADVRIGGIIIGCATRRVKTHRGIELDDAALDRLYSEAMRVRELYVYRQQGIRLFTWDIVLDYIRPTEPIVGQQFIGGAVMAAQ